jgi:AcrR family transcriptional regulator
MNRKSAARSAAGAQTPRTRRAPAGATSPRRPARTPQQPAPEALAPAVAHEPLAAILAAAGQLIDEHGVDGLNTTAVARRAGISTATLYRHFPDKHAILDALVLDLHAERGAAVKAIYRRIGDAPDWRAPLAEAAQVAWRMRLARPGGRSTRRALQTSPELWQWDQAQNMELARALGSALRRRKPGLSRATAERIALVALTAMIALMDVAGLEERHGEAILEEARIMREAYLAQYLD